ncbi:MAG: aminotransferase class V-fold PLP-dependent enzyme [Neomegalonema sp.]|nr:aminotransferase class V-fold PLP-dependent enzyme [Neomegalonema sp.]
MPLSHGRKLIAFPGPTNLPDEVLQAMHAQSIDIYGDEAAALTDGLLTDLRKVFRTEAARTFIYIANGHGGWEAALANTLSRGDRVLVLDSGSFAKGWGEMAQTLGVDVDILPGRPGRAVDANAVEARLRDDLTSHGDEQRYKAVLTVQIDTASSTVNDLAAIRAAISAAGHPALYGVDGVASIGCMPFEMDAWGVDLALTGSQKGLMTPPGLAFLAVGPRAWAMRGGADLHSRYWGWDERLGEIHYMKYCGTPPMQLLYALRRALDLLLREEGLEAAWARHKLLANATRAAVQHWSAGGAMTFYAPEPAERCDTVTTLVAAEGLDSGALRRFCLENCGVAIGVPTGDLTPPDRGFRIAHMGHWNAPMALGALGAVELAMTALGWPGAHGGVSAAAALLGESLRV